ncbi:hypothetical protein ASPZODRAFT_163589 [Penicilliopsis zonata CBS 506.65]|uniref:Fungal N-terminal domain-containing protein n=1 Tax=Penicilliopsis zonata CBS 506.65 TaxID=1073090 RepID=A0A1L9SX90_9EURO|nr:hypothetical protein ASPZODRAFT_163589 [Penicilliopsis zonata CBS 506.65]OJJ51815.1 hypothetical protein ASPZODRAFT_163589 [Penicilliopsis zonata CBS 506.65]
MGDPFSAASSAVGIISLGLATCQQIVDYCSAWRDCDQDIRDLQDKAGGLGSTLISLQQYLIARPATDLMRNDIEIKLQSCQSVIGRLKVKIKSYQLTSSSWTDQIRHVGHKAVYPFKKEGLLEMRDHLQEIQSNLNSSLLVSQLMQTCSLLTTVTDHHVSTTASLVRMESEIAVLQRLLSSPALLQQACNADEAIQATQNVYIPRRPQRGCQCPLKPFSAGQKMHFPTCPRFRSSKQSQTNSNKWSFTSQLLGMSVSVMFASNTGNGGFSICPLLHFRAIVPYDHPSFKAIAELRKPFITIEDIENTINKLHDLFSRGKASPTDVDSNGKTILHRCCFSVDGKLLPSLSRLVQYMIDAGTPLDVVDNNFGYSTLDSLLRIPDILDHVTLDPIIQSSSSITPGVLGYYTALNFKLNLQRIANFLDPDVFNDVVIAIFRRSKDDLKLAVTSFPFLLNTKIRSILPIELSADWAEGIEILLAAGALPRGYALQLAVETNSLASTRMLLRAGCEIGLFLFVLSISTSLLNLLATELASRRQQLKDLAKLHLPSAELARLGIVEDELPDSRAKEICESLTAAGVAVDQKLIVERTDSVFHYCETIESLELLYNAGFKQVDDINYDGWTPILRVGDSYLHKDILPKAHWLLSKGADAYRHYPGSTWTFFHQLFEGLTWCSRKAILTYSKSLKDSKLLSNVSLETMVDDCCCACSGNGCSPELVGFKGLLNDSLDHPFLMRYFDGIFEAMVTINPKQSHTATLVIRLFTFTELDLTHTCCYYLREGRGPPPEIEIERIQEEDTDCLKELEELLKEFNMAYTTLNVPLLQFLRGYWKKRMMEIKTKGPDEEDIIQGQELGVFLKLEREKLWLNPWIEFLVES